MLLSTINRTLKAYLLAIVGAEYVLRWLPVGTHQWERFVTPGRAWPATCRRRDWVLPSLQGLVYSPLADTWSLSADTDVNYLAAAAKPGGRVSPARCQAHVGAPPGPPIRVPGWSNNITPYTATGRPLARTDRSRPGTSQEDLSMRTWSLLAVGVGLSRRRAPAHAQQRQAGAHEHGRGTLNIALEGSRLSMELEAPGADIVGFEHKAKTQKQKAAVEKAKKQLAAPQALFELPAAAGCVLRGGQRRARERRARPRPRGQEPRCQAPTAARPKTARQSINGR